MKFKVGDRVAVYEGYESRKTGVVKKSMYSGDTINHVQDHLSVQLDKEWNFSSVYHHKQCRRLVKKVKDNSNTPYRKDIDGLKARLDLLEKSFYVFKGNTDNRLICTEFDFKERLHNIEKWIYQELQELHKRIMDDPAKHNNKT